MDNLKQKIDAEIGCAKWNDALSEAIQKKAQKKSFSRYAFVTACAVALACFLLVLNLQPAQITNDVQTGDITSIQVKEIYVTDAKDDTFRAQKSNLYLQQKHSNFSNDSTVINTILSSMQPVEQNWDNYYEADYSKDILIVEPSGNDWRIKLSIYNSTIVFIENYDTGEIFKYTNEEPVISNPIYELFLILDAQEDKSIQLLFALILSLAILIPSQIFFAKKYNIKHRDKIFEDSIRNTLLALGQGIFMLLLVLNFNIGWIRFIPTVLFLFAVVLCLYLWIVYRNQSKPFFVRECISMTLLFTILCYILLF